VVRIRVHRLHELDQAVQDPVEHAVLDRVRQPPRRRLAELRPQHLAVVGEHPLGPPQHRVEQLLVPVVGREHAQRAPGEWRQRHAVDGPADLLVERAVHVLVAQHVGESDGGIGAVAGQGRRVRRVGQPGRDPVADTGTAQPGAEHVGAEEVLLHERAERGAELVLALPDHGRVGDREAERMAEQRGHCEPVRQPADHRPFGRRLEVAADAGVGGEQRQQDEGNGGEDQQAGRPALHRRQVPAALGFAPHRGRRGGGDADGQRPCSLYHARIWSSGSLRSR
jgi:hypothetical protein